MRQIKMDYRMKAKKLVIPKGHRIIIISDIHGRLSYLKGLLHRLSFSCEDYLLIAGDILDKGEDSLSTLRYLMELEKKYHVHMVCGNVDARVIEYLETPDLFFRRYCFMMKHWGHSIYDEMLREQGLFLKETGERSAQALETERAVRDTADRLRKVSVQEAFDCILGQYEKELRFIQELPMVLDAGAFLVTHAGLPSEDYERLSETDVKKMLSWKSFQDENLYFSRYVFVGHWPVTIYERGQMDSSPIINREKRIVSLDGGCVVKRDGQLNAVVLPDIDAEEFETVSYDDFPRARVLEDREGKAGTFYIRWKDRFVEQLKQDEEGSLVRILSTGEEHWIPRTYLCYLEEEISCSDYTDYELPLCAGDEVSVLGSYRRGYLLRKNGVLGWYDGELERLSGEWINDKEDA